MNSYTRFLELQGKYNNSGLSIVEMRQMDRLQQSLVPHLLKIAAAVADKDYVVASEAYTNMTQG